MRSDLRVASGALADKKSFYTARFSGLSKPGDRERIAGEAAAIERCINEWFIDF